MECLVKENVPNGNQHNMEGYSMRIQTASSKAEFNNQLNNYIMMGYQTEGMATESSVHLVKKKKVNVAAAIFLFLFTIIGGIIYVCVASGTQDEVLLKVEDVTAPSASYDVYGF